MQPNEKTSFSNSATYQQHGRLYGTLSDRVKSGRREKMPTFSLIWSVFTASLGPLGYGYQLGITSVSQSFVESWINESYAIRGDVFVNTTEHDVERLIPGISPYRSQLLFSTFVAFISLGGGIGTLAAAPIMDRWGRITAFSVSNIIGGVCTILLGLCAKFTFIPELTILLRLFTGMASGMQLCVTPTYISEVSPTESRGITGFCSQLALPLGIFSAQVFGLPWLLGQAQSWWILYILACVPFVLQMACLALCKESPRHVFVKSRNSESTMSILKMFQRSDSAKEQLEEMEKEHNDEKK